MATTRRSRPAGAGGHRHRRVGAHRGLSPATSYHYRIVASNSVGTVEGGSGVFNTSAAPSVVTGAATGLTASTAILNGVVNSQALATTWHFQYGTTAAYGSKTPNKTLAASPNQTDVTYPIVGLTANQTYHFRLVATSSAWDESWHRPDPRHGGTGDAEHLGVDGRLRGCGDTLRRCRNRGLGNSRHGRIRGIRPDGVYGHRLGHDGDDRRLELHGKPDRSHHLQGRHGSRKQLTGPDQRAPGCLSERRLGGEISTRVVGGISFAGHILQLQRLSNGLWVQWKQVRLNSGARATFATSLPNGRTAYPDGDWPLCPRDQSSRAWLPRRIQPVGDLREELNRRCPSPGPGERAFSTSPGPRRRACRLAATPRGARSSKASPRAVHASTRIRRMHPQPVASDVHPSTDPDAFVAAHVIDHPLQRRGPARPTDDPAVEPDREHLRAALLTLSPEHIESVAAMRLHSSPVEKPPASAKRMSLVSMVYGTTRWSLIPDRRQYGRSSA